MAIHSEVISELGEVALELIWNNTNDAIFTLGQEHPNSVIGKSIWEYVSSEIVRRLSIVCLQLRR